MKTVPDKRLYKEKTVPNRSLRQARISEYYYCIIRNAFGKFFFRTRINWARQHRPDSRKRSRNGPSILGDERSANGLGRNE